MADTLAEVLRDQNEKAKGWQQSPEGQGRKKTSPFTWVVLIAGLVLSGFVWFAPPSWLDPSPTPLSPALTEAGLRMEVFQQALLVKQFLESQGRLPDNLAEASAPFTEVGYQKIDAGRYRLTLSSPVASVEYLSTDSLETFLGNSLQIIRQGG